MTDGKHSVTTEEASVLTKVAQLMTLRSTRGSTDGAFVTVYPGGSKKALPNTGFTTGPSKRSREASGLVEGGSPKKM
jgi:hypothetical protein